MQKRNIQILSIGLFFLLFLMQSPQSGAASVSAYNAATIVVTAGSDALVVGTPIIIAGSEFSGDFALATAVVMDGATALPTQYDAGLDELVFQLSAAVAASGSGHTTTPDVGSDGITCPPFGLRCLSCNRSLLAPSSCR